MIYSYPFTLQLTQAISRTRLMFAVSLWSMTRVTDCHRIAQLVILAGFHRLNHKGTIALFRPPGDF